MVYDSLTHKTWSVLKETTGPCIIKSYKIPSGVTVKKGVVPTGLVTPLKKKIQRVEDKFYR